MVTKIKYPNDVGNDIEKFFEFIQAKRIKKDDNSKKRTHTLMEPEPEYKKYLYQGKLHISGKDSITFLRLYKNVYGKIPLNIVERHNETDKEVGPYVVDIDYKTKKNERFYNDDHIKSVIKICNEIFKKYLEVNDDNLISYVSEKMSPSKDKEGENIVYKDGFHIFYDIPLSSKKREFIYSKILEKITNEDVFGDIEHNTPYDKLVDQSVIKANGLLMYGSSKCGRKPYVLTKVYNSKIEEEPLEDYNNFEDLIHLFSLQRYNDDDDIEFVKKYRNDNIENEDNKKKENRKEKILTKLDSIVESYPLNSHPSIENIPDEYKDVFTLVDMLSVKRATEYNGWIRVGWALYNTSTKLYNLFIHFSKKAKNFDEEGCKRVWTTAKNDGSKLTLSSLNIWAKQDNPELYKKTYYGKLKDLALKIKNPNHDDIANIIYTMYGDEYKCTNIKNNFWYQFQGHRWVAVDSAYTLQEKIASEVTKELIKVNKFLLSDEIEGTSGQNQDDSLKQIQKLLDTVLKLKDQNYGSTLIKTCARKFYDAKFEESLDSKPHLIGFENGIYDLKLMEFRDGMPDDRVTFSTKFDYHVFTKNDQIIKNINSFIKKIQPEDHMRNYVLRLFSSCLDGKNRDQQFRIFTGQGSNGKSKLIDLLTETLGQYAGGLPSEVLTIKNNNPNGASPFLADKKGKRFLIIQEPESDTSIQVGKMKLLTGGDKLVARGLFKDPIEFVPQFKIILVCNKRPKVESDDWGTWRRLRVTPFTSKFVKNIDEVNEKNHHYLADLSIDEERLSIWAPAFMWMLINVYYVEYIKPISEGGGLNEPAEVIESTEKYKKENDVLYEYIQDNIKITNDPKDSEKILLILDQFRIWHKENYNYGTKLARKDIEEYFVEKLRVKIEKGLIYGVKGLWDAPLNTNENK